MNSNLSRRPSWDRPGWARDEKTYEAHMRAERPHSPRQIANTPDFGSEPFSFASEHLQQWLAPPTIMYCQAAFPHFMQLELDNWSHAGAAVCTALERIDVLFGQASTRGWPGRRGLANFSRQSSIGSPMTGGGAADTSLSLSPIGSPVISPILATSTVSQPATMILTPPSTAETSATTKHHGSPPAANRAVDSPLISPAGANTPASGTLDPKQAGPDLSNFPAELSPHLSVVSQDSGAQTPGAAFDENAWEVYLGSFHAELSDIRARAMSRWKGYTRTLDRLRIEYSHMPEFEECMHTFEKWWFSVKPEMAIYEDRVKALRVPDLEQVKKQRLDLGLPL